MKQYSRWFSKGIACVALGILAVFCSGGIGIKTANAANSCECFCGDKKQGAGSIGAKESTSECANTCAKGGSAYVGCYTDESLYPENNNLCWTQDECTTYDIDVSGTTYKGTWSEQNPYCSKQSVTGSAMGYCYGPLIPVVLNVPILGVTSVGSIGDYVNLVYKYAIPAAALFAVLMFTIAGFQYMTAAGDKGAVSKAKDRMVNTVVGIVLLMSVYTIAYLIDPRLTRFNELRPPLVKKAVMVNDLTTCEALYSYGYCIDGDCPEKETDTISGTCGDKGEITGADSLDATVVNGPEVGDTCYYSGCTNKAQTCIMKGDNSSGMCVSCNDVSQVRENTPGQSIGLSPSQSVCSQIASRAQTKDGNDDHVYACYFDDDFTSLSQGDGGGADECVQLYTSGKEYIDCEVAIRTKAKARKDGCGAYEYVNADSYGWAWSGNFEELFGQGSVDGIEDFRTTFASLCESDICSVANLGSEAQGSCTFEDTSLLEDVADQFLSVGLFTFFDNYACVGAVTASRKKEEARPSNTDYDPPSKL